MSRQSMSLLDVLIPPGNRWLATLPRSAADLPPGVRVVRFSESDDDGPELAEPAAKRSNQQRLAEA